MKYIFIVLAIMLFTNTSTYTQIIYVDSSAILGLNSGETWDNAFLDLQSATQSAMDGQEIWVAKGTYLPTSGNDKTIYFELKSGVRLLGGFEGDEVDAAERDWNENETILSGDIGAPGDSTDNAYTILYAAFTDTTTTVDGFIFEGGHAENDTALVSFMSPKKNGGAIYLNGNGGYAALNILNCEMRNCNAKFNGGAIYLNGLSGSIGVTIDACKMQNNKATNGGAVYQTGEVVEYFGNKILNSKFENNSINGGTGGAICIESIGGEVAYKIQNCFFLSNSALATIGGGAITYHNVFTTSNNYLLIDNCQFQKNSANIDGAAIFYLNSSIGAESLLVNNCEFIENSGSRTITIGNFEDYNERININNTLFKNNKGQTAVRGFVNQMTNCIFENNSNGAYLGSIQNNDEQFPANISNCTFFTNDSTKNNIILTNHELIINNSIFYNDFLLEDTIIKTSSHLTLNNCLLTSPSCDSVITAFYDTLLTCNNLILNADPLFRDTAAGDFSLLACSPAIDAGDNSFYDFVENPTDFDSSDRLINGTIDIGAHESPVTLTVDSVANVACYSDSTGIVFPVFNGPAPYAYAWSNGQAIGDDIENLEAGIYQLTVTDANDCSDSIFFEILEPDPIVIAYTTDSISCHDSLDGYANSLSSGGVAPYIINWENGETGNEVFALGEGYNLVSVTDDNGCMVLDSVFIGEPLPINIVGNIIDASGANTQDGSIEVTNIIGGTPPFELLWSNGETTGLIENLLPSDYLLTVTDANGCTYMGLFIVSFLDAIKTIEENEIRIFPNPVIASAEIYFILPKKWESAQVFIYDAIGKLIKNQEGEQIDANTLMVKCPDQEGLFLFEFRYAAQVVFKKVMVVSGN
ncbi:MAG: hypothetical protein ACI8VT_003920 [Saprospiraceae bacterium]|jgi:hypothetical protein